MNTDLILRQEQLPDNIEELAKFVLIGREQVTAVRAKIRAITKVGTARAVYIQKPANKKSRPILIFPKNYFLWFSGAFNKPTDMLSVVDIICK